MTRNRSHQSLLWLSVIFLVLGILALTPMTCAAQDARGFDWKPVLVLTVGASLDVASTEHAIARGCSEANTRYFGYDGFTPSRPDVNRMWTDKAALLVGTVAASIVVHRLSNGPGKMKTVSRFIAKGTVYSTGVAFGVVGAMNTKRCGW